LLLNKEFVSITSFDFFIFFFCVKEYIRVIIFEIALIFKALSIINKNNKKKEKKKIL